MQFLECQQQQLNRMASILTTFSDIEMEKEMEDEDEVEVEENSFPSGFRQNLN